MTQTKPVSFSGVICKSRVLASQALATVTLRKSADITLDQLRQNVCEAVRADDRFPTVKAKDSTYTNSPWVRDILMPEKDGGEWTAIVTPATPSGYGDMVKIGFTVAADGTVKLAKGEPVETKMIYKSATFSGVIGSGAVRERAVALVSAAGDALKKSADAQTAPAPAPSRLTFTPSFTLSKGNTAHAGRRGGGSYAKSTSVGKMSAKRPRFRIGQRVTTGDGETGKVTGNKIKGGEHFVELSVGQSRHVSAAESECTLSKSVGW